MITNDNFFFQHHSYYSPKGFQKTILMQPKARKKKKIKAC